MGKPNQLKQRQIGLMVAVGIGLLQVDPAASGQFKGQTAFGCVQAQGTLGSTGEQAVGAFFQVRAQEVFESKVLRNRFQHVSDRAGNENQAMPSISVASDPGQNPRRQPRPQNFLVESYGTVFKVCQTAVAVKPEQYSSRLLIGNQMIPVK